MVAIKICGITEKEALQAAVQNGAQFAGFVFYPKSPRNVLPESAAQMIDGAAIKTVGLFVDPDDHALTRVLQTVRIDMIQLHGNETPSRVAAIKSHFKKPVMKALRIATKDDAATASNYPMADWLLFDAKVDGVQGGSGRTFDWTILQNFKSSKPWMLAGGLHAQNVGDALRLLKPDAVDVSSGVESAPGVKDTGKIAEFVNSVRHAQ